jgi:flagellar FliL protein
MSASKGENAPAKTKKSRKWLLALSLGGIVLGAVGGGAFFWWKSQQAGAAAHAAGEHAAPVVAEPVVSGALPFQPFVVNLADAGGTRYLKADLRLLVSGVENLKELEENEVVMLRLRSAILEYLSQQTADRIVTPEGKEALKRALAERCTALLEHGKVSDVLFAEFVVQF